MVDNKDCFRSANRINALADMTEFHSERLLALQLSKNGLISIADLILDPQSINRHLMELDSLIQTMSFVGKVRSTENTPSMEVHEEEVYAFGQKKRSHEKQSSAVESRGTLMAYTRVALVTKSKFRLYASGCSDEIR